MKLAKSLRKPKVLQLPWATSTRPARRADQVPGIMDWAEAVAAVRAYGRARMRFRRAQETFPRLLGGNDNKVGVCGEFWAKKLYSDQGCEIAEVPASNNEGYDFSCRRAGKLIRVSVKVVSDESRSGRQLRLKSSLRWDELLYVLLGCDMAPYRFGLVTRTQFARAVRAGAVSATPVISRSHCNPKGWLPQYGRVWDTS